MTHCTILTVPRARIKGNSSKTISATILSSHPEQPSLAAILSSQLLVRLLTSSCCGQGLVVSYSSTIEHQFAVVIYDIICCGQGLVISYLLTIQHQFAVARDWWSAVCQLLNINFLSSTSCGSSMNTFLERTLCYAFGKKWKT